ncbi:hypothetical protein [Flavobacterium hydatis]|uniref:Lipoprotein n=1 Tax=Flavobacterium hydatis TaxID=991 RepID=A0A086AIQ7_FLAHY|nr:hypothetical protein [Flavobacterium hydatis]KFF16571.1 hypothetical protein IW20_10410 [Flavobacterium hydatis]OXA90229.1 hypothetical protein B0A62_19340 [Flavobacterium hydatis]
MKNLILILLLIFISCNRKNQSDYRISAVCEKIIVQDSINKISIHFLVSFDNPNEKEMVFFANSYNINTHQKKYKFAGVYLRFNNSNILLGQPNSSTVFHIKPKSKIKILYTYSKQYQNERLNIDNSKSFIKQLNEIKLYYKYNKKVMDSILFSDENLKSNVATFTSNFEIKLKNTPIEFNKHITIEDVNKLGIVKQR